MRETWFKMVFVVQAACPDSLEFCMEHLLWEIGLSTNMLPWTVSKIGPKSLRGFCREIYHSLECQTLRGIFSPPVSNNQAFHREFLENGPDHSFEGYFCVSRDLSYPLHLQCFLWSRNYCNVYIPESRRPDPAPLLGESLGAKEPIILLMLGDIYQQNCLGLPDACYIEVFSLYHFVYYRNMSTEFVLLFARILVDYVHQGAALLC